MNRIIIACAALAAWSSVCAQSETNDSAQVKSLNEVIVTGEKPQISGRDGVMVVDLPSIVADKPVTNVLEALGYLPGVIDNNGAIGLSGASSVSVIINGELTSMPLQNLYQLLYSTPVDRLKNVEIMYSAPAKYHTAGAVINVVLKTPRPLDGLMGQASAGYNWSHFASCSAGLNATYAVKDWNFALNWNTARNHTFNRQETFSNHLYNGSRHMIEDDMRQISRNWSNTLFASAAYKNLKISYNAQITSNIRNKSLSAGTLGHFSNFYRGISPTAFHNVALRYVAPFGLSAGADFTRFNEHRNQNLYHADELQSRSSNQQRISRYHAYIDQEHSLGNWTIGYGADYKHASDNSRQIFEMPPQQGFRNTLREDVVNVYASAQASFQWGLSFNASLAAEYFHNDYRTNWNLIPQLGATFYKTPSSIFQLNFTSNRIYPSYWELHGGTAYVNDYATIIGNPALQPYMNYSAQINYIFKQKYAATFFMLYSDDYSVQLPYQSTSHLALVFQTLNMDFSQTVGFQLHIPFDVKEVWSATATASISYSQQKSSQFHDLSFNNKRWKVYTALDNTLRLRRNSPVALSIDASYLAGQIQGPGRISPLCKIDAGIKWQFGINRCCELTLKANDIFNTCNPRLTINFSGQDYRMDAHNMNRSLSATFVYRFNGFKPQPAPTIDSSRFGTN